MPGLLAHTNLQPDQFARLDGPTQDQVLRFLLRWEAYDNALSCLGKIQQPWPANAYYAYAAYALEGTGHGKRATEAMTRHLELENTPVAVMRLALVLFRQGDLEEARSLAGSLQAQPDQDGQLLGLKGEYAFFEGDLNQAERLFLAYAKLHSSQRHPYAGLAKVYRRAGYMDRATHYARFALRAAANSDHAAVRRLRDLGELLQELGLAEEAGLANEELRVWLGQDLASIRKEMQVSPDARIPQGMARLWRWYQTRREVQGVERANIQSRSHVAGVDRRERRTLTQAARKLFGFRALMPDQAEIMVSTRRGEDILAVLPTGAGKSLCYQLPAFLDEGTTVVIAPLISLMKDQIDKLPKQLRSQAIALNSSLDGRAMQQVLAAITAGKYRLVYLAPERLRQPATLFALQQAGVSRLVVDEAHCISMWGHDFRPDYLSIAHARRRLGAPVVLAMTATAPVRVREDIQRRLGTEAEWGWQTRPPRPLQIIMADTYRPNLRLSVRHIRSDAQKRRMLAQLCRRFDGSGIIYARTRRRCEDLADMLRAQGFDAAHYHAGVPQRAQLQDRFMHNQIRIMVATIAFGMGVDKPDIRFILHDGLPDSIEAYYQEIGRAGRDGGRGECVLLSSRFDETMLKRRAEAGRFDRQLLLRTYKTVMAVMGSSSSLRVEARTLSAEIGVHERTIDLMLSAFEEMGLLHRHADSPKQVVLRLRRRDGPASFQSFMRSVGAQQQKRITYDFGRLAQLTSLPPEPLAYQLLEWQHQGLLTVFFRGREMLISREAQATDLVARLDKYLEHDANSRRYRLGQVIAYTRNGHCRHGFLSAYLGSDSRDRCRACDHCIEIDWTKQV